MDSIVDYKERGNFGNNKYRGNCSGKLILDLNKVFKFNSISDYMRGSNTVGDAAKFLKIKSNTYDLNMGYDLIDEEIKELNEFIFFHPPYWDIIKYSGFQYGNEPLKNDLSNIKDYKEFIRVLNYCIEKQYSSLKVGGRMAILMADIKKHYKLYSMLLDMKKIGTIEQIVIKKQNNIMSENKKYFNENFIRITHEYVLILRKDYPYLYNYKIVVDESEDIRDKKDVTWKDLVASVLAKLGGKANLCDIYREVYGHKKTLTNKNWQAKIRQTLQIYNIFSSFNKGIWELAA